jgi:hypothetical protein
VNTRATEAAVEFLILMADGDGAWDALAAAEQASVLGEHAAAERELRERGNFVASWRLRPAAEARSLVRDAHGAFTQRAGAEVAPLLGGAYLIEVASRSEAERWARRLRFIAGANEVREVWE